MEKNSDSSCSSLLGLLFLGFVVFQVIRFVILQVIKTIRYFESPGNVEQFILNLKALGICFGSILLAIVLLRLYFMIIPGNSEPRLRTMSEEFRVCCIPEVMSAETKTQDVGKPHAPQWEELISPIYLLMSITNFGVCLRPIPKSYTWKSISADNESRYHVLSSDRADPIVLPMGFTHLYYILSYKGGEAHLGCQVEQSGLLPVDLGNNQVEIVFIYNAILEDGNLAQIIRMDRELRIKLTVLDQDGQDDEKMTCKLYNDLYEFMNPPDTSYDDYEYYRQRPIWY